MLVSTLKRKLKGTALIKSLFIHTEVLLKSLQYEIFSSSSFFFFLIYLDVLLMGLVDFLLVAEFLLSPKPMHV